MSFSVFPLPFWDTLTEITVSSSFSCFHREDSTPVYNILLLSIKATLARLFRVQFLSFAAIGSKGLSSISSFELEATRTVCIL
jgi:hypothetical protein